MRSSSAVRGCAPRARAFGTLRCLSGKREVVVDRLVRVEREVLEHDRDVAIAGPHVVDALVVDEHVAGRRRLEPHDGAQERRLAGAGRPEDGHELAVVHVERDLVQRDLGAVAGGDALQADGGHQRTASPVASSNRCTPVGIEREADVVADARARRPARMRRADVLVADAHVHDVARAERLDERHLRPQRRLGRVGRHEPDGLRTEGHRERRSRTRAAGGPRPRRRAGPRPCGALAPPGSPSPRRSHARSARAGCS